MKPLTRLLIAAVFLLPGSIQFFGCRSADSNAESSTNHPQIKTVKVGVIEVRPMPISDILVLPGETEAWQDVRVSADTGGRVDWIGPREGDKVTQGELLARIDVSDTKAVIDRTEAAYRLADDLYQRRKKLFDRGIIHQEALEQSLTEKTVAESDLQKARVEYERGFPRAPITGTVNHLHVDEGEFLNRGQALVDLVNVDRIRIHVNVPELDVRYIRKGQTVRVGIDAFPDRELAGRVDFVSYKADPSTKTFLVRVLIDNAEHDIRPGMIARAAFVRRVIPDALIAPLFALQDKGGERILFIEKQGVVQARTVTIGIIEGDRVQITTGLEPGDRLIVTGQRNLEEGMKVQAS